MTLPGTTALLVAGGDERLDLLGGVNRYGCAPSPETGAAAFASSTASTISPGGWAAADALRERLVRDLIREPPRTVYGHQTARLRRRLAALCELEEADGVEVALAASGTDLCWMAADMVAGDATAPLLSITLEAGETGGGVPAALAGRRFPGPPALSSPRRAQWRGVASRGPDGIPRPEAEVAAELEGLVAGAAAAGGKVLLVLTDVSKTGLIAPSPDTVLALRQRWPEVVRVLVDACQFRLSPEALRRYLAQDFLVAVTGSKFITGPAFCGALLVPARLARRLRSWIPDPALSAVSAPADWPEGWAARGAAGGAANFGLLLRWEAALYELAAFRRVPSADVEAVLRALAAAVESHLGAEPALESLPSAVLDRGALGAAGGWDLQPTIFPFLLRRPGPGGRYLDPEETAAVHCRLAAGEQGRAPVHLGQPVAVGRREGQPVSALRLCASARLVVEAASGAAGLAAVIDRAHRALDRAVGEARRPALGKPAGAWAA